MTNPQDIPFPGPSSGGAHTGARRRKLAAFFAFGLRWSARLGVTALGLAVAAWVFSIVVIARGDDPREVAAWAWAWLRGEPVLSYGYRSGRGTLVRACGSAGSESAVVVGLRWLERHQDPDGKRWDPLGWRDRCRADPCRARPDAPPHTSFAEDGEPAMAVAINSLGLLSILAEGHTHRFGRRKRAARNVLRWLRDRQRADGTILLDASAAPPTGLDALGHAVATAALAETYAMSRDFTLKVPTGRAVTALLALQAKDGGWGDPDAGSDLLTTAFATLALRTAIVARLDVPEEALLAAAAFARSDDVAVAPEVPLHLPEGDGDDRALELATRLSIRLDASVRGRGDDREASWRALVATRPVAAAGEGGAIDHRTWYFTSRVAGLLRRPGTHAWFRDVEAELLERQHLNGCADGSWDPAGRWGLLLGRTGTTALASLTLSSRPRCWGGSCRQELPAGE